MTGHEDLILAGMLLYLCYETNCWLRWLLRDMAINKLIMKEMLK